MDTSPIPSTTAGERIDDPKYKGVRKRKWGKWVSEIRLPNSRERIWLGSYDTPEKAARAFDAALFCLRGQNASFNFADDPPDIVGGQSLSPQEIQVVAARFANERESEREFSDQGTSPEMLTAPDNADRGDDETTIDWSFLNSLDSSNGGMSDFGYYSGFENIGGGEFFPPPPEPPVDNDGDENGGYGFSDPSFLWNF